MKYIKFCILIPFAFLKAGAQSFNSGGPLGNFGASASNSQSQGFNFNNGAFNGNANAAGSQTYNFGDKKISIAFSNGFNIGPDGMPQVSNSNSISYTKWPTSLTCNFKNFWQGITFNNLKSLSCTYFTHLRWCWSRSCSSFILEIIGFLKYYGSCQWKV